MAPPRFRQSSETLRLDAPGGRENAFIGRLTPPFPHLRKPGASTMPTTNSTSRELAQIETTVGTYGSDGASGQISWTDIDASILHAYRHAYRMNIPSAFCSRLNQNVLKGPGIGKQSPTMALRKDRRKIGGDQLAKTVRKNFNSLGIQEGDVVVDFLYKVKWQGKSFRMRFGPQRAR